MEFSYLYIAIAILAFGLGCFALGYWLRGQEEQGARDGVKQEIDRIYSTGSLDGTPAAGEWL